MKKFIMFPDSEYSRYSEANKVYLKKLRMLCIEFMIEYYHMPYDMAERMYDFFSAEWSQKNGSAFFAVDLSFDEQRNYPLYTVFNVKDPFIPLTEDAMVINQFQAPTFEEMLQLLENSIKGQKPSVNWEMN